MKNISYDVIIVGGGAAGLFCAGLLAQKKKKVLLLEHSQKVGQKILISGGGRCNFTNKNVSASDYVTSGDLHWVDQVLSAYPPSQFLSLVAKHNISFYEKKMGQLFCRERSQQIVDLLVKEIPKAREVIRLGVEVEEVAQKGQGGEFQLKSSQGFWRTKNLVVATGGLPLKKLGASDWGYRVARQWGLKVESPRQALVPLMVKGFTELMGVRVPMVQVRVGDQKVIDDLLFTHKGLSGPVILKASLFWSPGQEIQIHFLPSLSLSSELKKSLHKNKKASTVVKHFLPNRLVDFWNEGYLKGLLDKKVSELSASEISRIKESWQSFVLKPENYERMDKAEVTAGGVSTSELDPKSLMAQKCPGLYFIGEVVDVTGLLGGYNFQWAWSSAFVAAQALLKR